MEFDISDTQKIWSPRTLIIGPGGIKGLKNIRIFNTT
jgi:hypothetical protein